MQVFLDKERAGSGLLNFTVDDLEQHADALVVRGFAPPRSKRSTRVSSSRS
jgi:hypothetical protein